MVIEADIQAGRERRRAGLVLALCCTGAFLAFLDATIVNIAFPAIRLDFPRSSLSDLSWILNGYNVVIAAFLIPSGRVADRLGRRRVFLMGVGLFTIASAACAAAPSVPLLIAARVVQAVGAALLLPASLALLLPVFPPERRQATVAVWGAVAAVAAGLGPSLGGLIIEQASWRWVFLINVPVGVAALVLAPRSIEEARDEDSLRPDFRGAGLLALGVGALALALVQGHVWGWSSGRVLGALAVAVIGVVTAGVTGRREPAPVLDLRLLRLRPVAVASAATLLFATAFFAATLNNVLFLTGRWHWTVLHAGLAITPTPLLSAVVARPAGRLADRFGARAVVVPGAIVYVTGILTLRALSTHSPDFLLHWLPGSALVGIGVGLAFPTLGGAGLVGITAEDFAVVSAIGSAARQLGAVLGVALLVVVQSQVSPAVDTVLQQAQAGWVLAAVAGVACAAVSFALPRPHDGASE